MKINHPNLQDSWIEVTSQSSPNSVLRIPVGHCCWLKEKMKKKPEKSQSMPTAPILSGAMHYYQYDLTVGSTPGLCVDVFALGASALHAPVTHAVFPIAIALEIAKENHTIPLLELNGKTVTVDSVELAMLPSGFNKPNYKIKVVKISTTRTNVPPTGKMKKCL